MLHFTSNKTDFLTGINIALRAVPQKTTMPILQCIVLKAEHGILKLVSNNMDLGIETIVNAEVLEEGSIALDARLFSEIIRKLPENVITVKTDENYTAQIQCERSKFKIAGHPTEDFLFLPEYEKGTPLVLSQFTLKEVIRQTVFAISDIETNRLMTGEQFFIHDRELKITALDGHRIAIRKIMLDEPFEDINIVVPGKTLQEISKILIGDTQDKVSLYFLDNHILFEFDNTIVLSRLIEGDYYKIDQMLSSDYETKVTISNKELTGSIDRGTLLIRESDKKPVIMEITDGSMGVKIQSSMGTMDDEIGIEKEGKDLIIGFNPRLLLDSLKVIEDEQIDIYLINAKSPCFIRNEEQSYIYLILPINFN
jgi:DNA polymerase-3 subunit beta